MMAVCGCGRVVRGKGYRIPTRYKRGGGNINDRHAFRTVAHNHAMYWHPGLSVRGRSLLVDELTEKAVGKFVEPIREPR
mgnify:CR=1 FL=1